MATTFSWQESFFKVCVFVELQRTSRYSLGDDDHLLRLRRAAATANAVSGSQTRLYKPVIFDDIVFSRVRKLK